MTSLFLQCSKIAVIVATVLVLLARFVGTGRGTNSDLLAYTDVIYSGQGVSLLLYDVDNHIKVPVFTDESYSLAFSLSADGRLAYSSNQIGNREIYLLDTHATAPKARNITGTSATNESPLEWSLDGRYLAFIVSPGENPLLYVWDGETAINITPEGMTEPVRAYSAAWSADGRLAFTISFDNSSGEPPNEIYLWDGDTTTNLSQNPGGGGNWPVWSLDGRLAFLSERDGDYHIYVWDGVSVKAGSPDFVTFSDVSSELINYTSYPNWTNTGLLSFVALSPQDNSTQIYVWDGNTTTNLGQNAQVENGITRWSSDGRWSFTASGWLLLHDADNRLLLTARSQYPPAWSPGGFLLFCTYGWTLSVWDGQEIINVTQGNDIYAQWGNGNGVVCSSG